VVDQIIPAQADGSIVWLAAGLAAGRCDSAARIGQLALGLGACLACCLGVGRWRGCLKTFSRMSFAARLALPEPGETVAVRPRLDVRGPEGPIHTPMPTFSRRPALAGSPPGLSGRQGDAA